MARKEITETEKEAAEVAASEVMNMTLHQKLLHVMEEVGQVEKKGYNKAQNYNFIRETDVADAVRLAFVKYRLEMLPSIEEVTHAPVEMRGFDRDSRTEYTRTTFSTLVKMRFTILDSDEPTEQESFVSYGFGLDAQDKSLAKAITMAQKYGLLKRFMIGSDDDNESDDAGTHAPAASAPRVASQASTGGGYRGEMPKSADEWYAYWQQFPFEYDIPYKVAKDNAKLKELLKGVKAQFRGGKNRDGGENGDTGANKHWYSKTEVPELGQYLLGAPQGTPAPQKELSFDEDTLPF